jgi:hypothetical protein
VISDCFPLKIWPNFQEKSFVEVALAFLLSPSDKSSPKQKEKLLEAHQIQGM